MEIKVKKIPASINTEIRNVLTAQVTGESGD